MHERKKKRSQHNRTFYVAWKIFWKSKKKEVGHNHNWRWKGLNFLQSGDVKVSFSSSSHQIINYPCPLSLSLPLRGEKECENDSYTIVHCDEDSFLLSHFWRHLQFQLNCERKVFRLDFRFWGDDDQGKKFFSFLRSF